MANEDLNKRNIEGLHQSLKDLRKKYEEMSDITRGFEKTIGMQQAEIAELKQKVSIMYAQNMGHGATA